MIYGQTNNFLWPNLQPVLVLPTAALRTTPVLDITQETMKPGPSYNDVESPAGVSHFAVSSEHS